MCAVTERFILRESAAAKADRSPACQTELSSGGIEDCKLRRIVGLDTDRPITSDGYLDSHEVDVSRWETATSIAGAVC